MKKLLILSALFVLFMASCEKSNVMNPVISLQRAEQKTSLESFPGTDIWAQSFVSPGKVSDVSFDQTRQLPSRKLGKAVFADGKTFIHSATVDSKVYNSNGEFVGYWMEADTLVHINIPTLDTTLHLARCRFFAGADSYPGLIYKIWYDQDRPSVMPIKWWITPSGKRIPEYADGTTFAIRADISESELFVTRWWIEEP